MFPACVASHPRILLLSPRLTRHGRTRSSRDRVYLRRNHARAGSGSFFLLLPLLPSHKPAGGAASEPSKETSGDGAVSGSYDRPAGTGIASVAAAAAVGCADAPSLGPRPWRLGGGEGRGEKTR